MALPVLSMLLFYLFVQNAVQSVLIVSNIFKGPDPFGANGVWVLPLIILLPQAILGLLFIHLMDGGLRDHGFTLNSPQIYIRPAILLGAAAAALYTLKNILSGICVTGFGAFHPSPMYVTVNAMLTNSLYAVVQAFLLCGVMQEFISRRAGGHVRILRWDMPLAGIAVSLIAVLYEVIPKLIYRTVHMALPDPFELAGALIFGATVLIYSYWYDRSRSLAAPVVAGATWGILSVVFYNLARSSPILNHMR